MDKKWSAHTWVCIIFFLFFIISGGCSSANPAANSVTGLEKTVVHADTNDVSTSRSGTGYGLQLSTFSTEYNKKTKGRANNISIASQSINGKVVNPGETFSYNEAVGPTTKKNGYKLARIFKNGEDAEGYGGGVCQVSSTLYNAALEAGLEITERHPHSKDVKYVEEGMDAATSYGSSDLKFINNQSYPIKIRSTAEEGKVTVSIYQS